MTKTEQLQSWNILLFDPKKTDIEEHIDLINTLGDMVHINRTVLNTAPTANTIFREVKQMTTEDKAMAGVLSKPEDMVVVGPTTRVTMALTNISIIHMINR